MSYTTTIGQKVVSIVAAAAMTVGMAVGMTTVNAQVANADEAAVRADATGVMKFNWSIDGKDYSRGSCFLINEDTVITGYHCTFFSSNELDYYGYSGKAISDLQDRMTYSVTVNRDVKVNATLVNASEEQDFAIFKLDQVINNHEALTFRDSTTVEAAETVYSLGYPANNDVSVIKTYTADDITINSGKVVKPEQIIQGTMDGWFSVNGYYVQSDVNISGGDSGGPMVDADGNVIGVSLMSSDSYAYCAASDVIISVLNDLGIEYSSTSGGYSATATDAAPSLSFTALDAAISKAGALDEDAYTADSYKKVTEALAAAQDAKNLEVDDDATEADVKAVQDQIDEATSALEDAINALEEKPAGPSLPLIIGIIVGVIVVIAVIIIIVVMSSKKKKKAAAAAAPQQPTVPNPYQAQQPTIAANPQQAQLNQASQPMTMPAATVIPAENVSETTILDEDGSDTVMLFAAASGGSLTRMSNNEHIPINKAEFTIGRERSKVDYALEGNSSISRIHARFEVRNDEVYLIDNKAANGTYVNGVKLRAGEEVKLNAGDIITLADEKFKYSN